MGLGGEDVSFVFANWVLCNIEVGEGSYLEDHVLEMMM